MSNWINHVKEYATSKGISYKEALKDPNCKSSYHSTKAEFKENKNFQEHKEIMNLKLTNTPIISLPKKMVYINKKW